MFLGAYLLHKSKIVDQESSISFLILKMFSLTY